MEVFASTACLPGRETLSERLQRYSAAGIRSVELGAGVTVAEVDLATLDSSDLSLLIHNYFPPPPESFVLNLASADATVRGRSIELASRAVELSASVGAPFYSVHAGFVVDPVDDGGRFSFPAPADDTQAAAAELRFVDSLGAVLAEATDHGVRILVENNVCTPELVGKLLYQTPAEFDRLFDRVPDRQLGILLDTGHLNVSAKTFGFRCSEFVDRLGDRVGGVHLHDNGGGSDEHQPVGEGGWIVGAFDSGRLAHVAAVIVEAKFEQVEALAGHVAWLQSRLTAGAPVE